jgi:tetratricopeptide (TPR) repeat protein
MGIIVFVALILRVTHLFIKLELVAKRYKFIACTRAGVWFKGSKRVSFAPMAESIRAFLNKISLLAALFGASLLAACATAPTETDSTSDEAPEPAHAIEVQVEPVDEDIMYRVMAGEYLGSEGDLQAAVDEYLEAAMQSDDPEIARRATRIAYAAEAWQQAAMAADRWAVLAPESVPAHESAATAMLRLGDFLGAEYQFIKILEILEDSTEAWVLVSRILSLSGDPIQADLVLEHLQSVREEADPASVYYARSQLAIAARDTEQAFEYARRAAELDPDRPQFLLWAGRVALNLELKDTGIEYIRRAWMLDPDNHDLALGYADLLARNGDEEGARKVMEGMEQTPDVMLSRILFELAAKHRSAAEELFSELAGMEWDDADEKAFYQAQSAEALGMSRQAIAYYAEVTGGDRALAAALRRAELIAMDGDMETARIELAKLRDGNDPAVAEQSWLAEARILREVGERETAFDVLDQAVANQPGSVAILYSHSLLAAELGRVDVAEKDLRTILASQPENAAALNALGYTLADQTGRYEEAEALIRQAYILQPEEPSIVDSMGWVAYRQGRLAEAEEFLGKAWGLDRNAEIAAHLGEVLWVSGKQDEAMKVWREGAEIDADNAVLVETLDRLGIDL